MANRRHGLEKRLGEACLVLGMLLMPGIGVSKDNYAHTGNGAILKNGAGECVRAADGDKVHCIPPDSDADGVDDLIDQCPRTPAGLTVDEYGCPPDADGDSVADSLDQCPDTRPGVRVDSKGCDLDLDGDGVPYYRDRCQLTPQGARVNAEGCAEKMLVQDAMLPAGDVLFGFDRADLTPAARTLLQDVAQSLKQRSDADSLLITGHTDSTGPAAYNQSLSEARAASVQRYLQEQAVNMRMRSQGQGESKPIASNDSREGRRKNRRVEIDVGATPE